MTAGVILALLATLAAAWCSFLCAGAAGRAFSLFLDGAPRDESCAAALTAVVFSGLAGVLFGGALVMAALVGVGR